MLQFLEKFLKQIFFLDVEVCWNSEFRRFWPNSECQIFKIPKYSEFQIPKFKKIQTHHNLGVRPLIIV